MAALKEFGPVRSVAVIGRTGSGKSNFVRAMILEGNISKEDIKRAEAEDTRLPKVSCGVQKCTTHPTSYAIPSIGGFSYELIDFMGLQDPDKEDQKALGQIARMLGCIPALVGIVYIVDGRVTPAEADNCQFLFNEFFADVKPENLLLVRSKCEEFDEYDADAEKKSLGDTIPLRIIEAEWKAINFSKNTPKNEIYEQVISLREKLSRWTHPLELSDKTKTALKHMPAYLEVDKYKKILNQQQKKFESLKESLKKLEAARKEDQESIAVANSQIVELQVKHANQLEAAEAADRERAASVYAQIQMLQLKHAHQVEAAREEDRERIAVANARIVELEVKHANEEKAAREEDRARMIKANSQILELQVKHANQLESARKDGDEKVFEVREQMMQLHTNHENQLNELKKKLEEKSQKWCFQQ